MSETKEEIAAQRDALQAEVEQLRGQLAAAGANRPVAAQHTFQLSQGQLAELEASGITNVNGVTRTTEEVRAMLTGDQASIEIADASAPVGAPGIGEQPAPRLHVTHVYPSVEPGKIDPAVAGQPGISGPAADSK